MNLPDTSVRLSCEWSAIHKVLFRFAFAYFVLYNLPFPLNVIPFTDKITEAYQSFWNAIVVWVGRVAFGFAITVQPNGSGDTTWNYVQLFCLVFIAILTAAIWSWRDRRRANYARLWQWLTVYLRFSLAATMIDYGAGKVIPSQFPDTSLDTLVQPFGDSSPMGLLWKFMGASLSFNVFTGGGEMLGGLLLTMRHTTLLGALVCIVVLSNVVMLNFSYDVPVKLFSSHLLAMAVLLTLPEARRLVNLFLFNRGVEAAAMLPLFATVGRHRAALALRTLLVVAFTGWALFVSYEDRQGLHDPANKSPLYGIWNVAEFEVDGVAHPPLVTDEPRWRRVIFDRPDLLVVQLMSDALARYRLELDLEKHAIALTKRGDPRWQAEFSYQQTAPDQIEMEGTFETQKIRTKLRRVASPQFPLVQQRFHWIHENTPNR